MIDEVAKIFKEVTHISALTDARISVNASIHDFSRE